MHFELFQVARVYLDPSGFIAAPGAFGLQAQSWADHGRQARLGPARMGAISTSAVAFHGSAHIVQAELESIRQLEQGLGRLDGIGVPTGNRTPGFDGFQQGGFEVCSCTLGFPRFRVE